MPRGVPHLRQRPPAGQRMADDGVAALADGQRRAPQRPAGGHGAAPLPYLDKHILKGILGAILLLATGGLLLPWIRPQA
jgi:hypothetical protein